MKVAYTDGAVLPPSGVVADKYLNADYFASVIDCDEVVVCGDIPKVEQAYTDYERPSGEKVKVTVIDAEADVVDDEDDDAEALFDVFKVTEGKRGKGPSKHNVTRAEAEAFIAENPDNTYEIVPDGQ